jgi:hypothetical protein
MAALTAIQLAPDAGTLDIIAQLVAAAGGGDSYFMTGADLLVVKNGGGGSITVTITASGADNFGIVNTAHDITRTVAAGAVAFIVPSTMARFRDSNGNVQIAYSGVTTVTVGVFRFPTRGV